MALTNKSKTITEYNQFILSWNNIKFRYDIDLLFLQEGSPKRLYAEIEKQCNLDVLEKSRGIFEEFKRKSFFAK